MQYRRNIIKVVGFAGGILIILALIYKFEPHLFNMDDGPYYSKAFEGKIDQLPFHSSGELQRFGKTSYIIESYLLVEKQKKCVLVLRRPNGIIIWKKIPIKHDGALGPLKISQKYTHSTWHGGWGISIKPEFQESGKLYLSPLGGFRFFYHSW
jgi:hypothetical protein